MSQLNSNSSKKVIEFVEITLTITGWPLHPDEEAPQMKIEAMEGLGTGLAFHLRIPSENEIDAFNQTEVDREAEVQSEAYVVSQISSGKRLGQRGVDTPRQAKKWIELLYKACDWKKGLAELIQGEKAAIQLKALIAQVEQARLDAIEQCLFVDNFGESD